MTGVGAMAKHGKKYMQARNKAGDVQEVVSFKEALERVKALAYAKFDESVDVSVNMGIDPEKGEQVIRGSVLLPHSRGKAIRVIVFAKGDLAQDAEKAGADAVGAEDLVKKIEDGWLEFDYAVATPDMMGMVGRLAKILGPRGLLPNKKVGTVTLDVRSVVSDLKKGRAFFKNDKQGIVHFSLGKLSAGVDALRENLVAFLKALVAAKPSSARGKYMKKLALSSTMGVGVPVNPDEKLEI